METEMKTKKCRYCQSDIPEDAKVCPNCRKKQKGKGLKIAAVIVVLLIIAGVAAGGSDKPESGGSDGTSENTPATEEKTVFEQGEKVVLDDVEFVLKGYERIASAEFETPKNGYEYIRVTVGIKNSSGEKTSYNSLDWKMENSKGQILDPAVAIFNTDTDLGSGELRPGGSVEGTIVFEQPEGDKNLKLCYYGNLFNDEPEFSIRLK